MTGFMTQQEAVGFAITFALDQQAFLTAWQAQQGASQQLTRGYVAPRIEPLSAVGLAHEAQLRQHAIFTQIYGNAEIKMVELGKLMAMQLWVDTDVSDGVHGGGHKNPPDEATLLSTCLPTSIVSSAKALWRQSGPTTFEISSLDNGFGVQRAFANPNAGQMTFVIGTNPNLLLVREHGGRYVLANGYHRTWMLRSRGVEMAPAVVMPVATPQELSGGVGFFSADLLTGPQPPLVDDFQGSSLSIEVDVRSIMRVIRISAELLAVPRLL